MDLLIWTTTPWTLVSNTAVAVHPDGRRQVLRRGDHPVVLTGEPVELLLRVFGRTEGVRVEVDGPSLSVSRFLSSQPGV